MANITNFIEWCKANNFEIPVFEEKAAMKKATKVKYTDKMSGKPVQFAKQLDDYKGHIGNNGTVEPFELKKKSSKNK